MKIKKMKKNIYLKKIQETGELYAKNDGDEDKIKDSENQ